MTAVRDHRSAPAVVRDHRSQAQQPTIRDHRSQAQQPVVRDHRAQSTQQPVIRDHRSQSQQPVVRDHRAQSTQQPVIRDHRGETGVIRDQRRDEFMNLLRELVKALTEGGITAGGPIIQPPQLGLPARPSAPFPTTVPPFESRMPQLAEGLPNFPGGDSTFDLAQQIANAPTFSATEQALLSKIKDPEQRAIQELQMQMQKQALLCSTLTNLANMRHEMLKSVSQNLRG